jgi:large subunit ribosomal protein L11
MAAKKIKLVIKLNLPAGKANPAPPVGPALGQHGVNIMDFCNKYNEATKDKMGQVIPAEVTIFEDRSFTFVTKLPPVSEMIRQTLKIKAGSATPGKAVAGILSPDQVKAIATEKLQDMNTTNLEAATRTVAGTAKSMGVKVQ